MEESERDEAEAAEDLEDLDVQPDEAEDVKGGNWGTNVPAKPIPPPPGG